MHFRSLRHKILVPALFILAVTLTPLSVRAAETDPSSEVSTETVINTGTEPGETTTESRQKEASTETKPVLRNARIQGRDSYSVKYTQGYSFYLDAGTDSDSPISYSSQDPDIAEVSSDGKVTLNSFGTCTILLKTGKTEKWADAEKTVTIRMWKAPTKLTYSSSYKKSKYYTRLTNLHLMDNTRSNLLAVSGTQLGYHESSSRKVLSGKARGKGNYTEYGRFYGNNGVPWCAIFVNWVARENGLPLTVVPRECAVRRYYSFYRKQKSVTTWNQVRNKKQVPKKGDIIFYSNRKGGTTHHIGYVEGVSYTRSTVTITTIEGNQKNQVRRVVMKMRRSNARGKVNGHYITGFASPRY